MQVYSKNENVASYRRMQKEVVTLINSSDTTNIMSLYYAALSIIGVTNDTRDPHLLYSRLLYSEEKN